MSDTQKQVVISEALAKNLLDKMIDLADFYEVAGLPDTVTVVKGWRDELREAIRKAQE